MKASDCYANGGYLGHQPGQLQQGLQLCEPPCDVPYSECTTDLRCTCKRGFVPTYLPAPILSSRAPKLILCSADPYRIDFSSPMDQNNTAKASIADAGKGDNGNGIQFYPDDGELNHWMLAMIGIGLIFIAFVGVSIYLMCKSNNQANSERNPKPDRTH